MSDKPIVMDDGSVIHVEMPEGSKVYVEAPTPARHLECWRCREPIVTGCYNLDSEGPSHRPNCP